MSEHQQEVRVVVAHGDEKIRLQASRLLQAEGFAVVSASDGNGALLALRSASPPAILVAGVALQEPAFYELCELIAAEGLKTRVLIVASVHSRGAYKRAPTELYGADACVDEHRLEEELAAQVTKLRQD